jgi:hypothetical protein
MMRTRLFLPAAVVSAVVALGGTAFAHGGSGSEHRAEPRRGNRFSFEVTGSQVPGGGDSRGAGHVAMALDPDKDVVCLRANWQGLEGEVTAIHIHKGPKGQNGPHHVEILNDESLAGGWNRVEFCVKVNGGEVHAHDAHAHDAHGEGHQGGSDPIEEMLGDPHRFYLNIHTTAFPKGALRGQLA